MAIRHIPLEEFLGDVSSLRPSAKNHGWDLGRLCGRFCGSSAAGGRLWPMAFRSVLPTLAPAEYAHDCTPDTGVWVCDLPAFYRPRHADAQAFYQRSSGTSTAMSRPTKALRARAAQEPAFASPKAVIPWPAAVLQTHLLQKFACSCDPFAIQTPIGFASSSGQTANTEPTMQQMRQ